MLRSITIKRFKSIREASIEFGHVNLFIGGNGSGKSNVLEAIGLMAASLSRGISDDELRRKGVRLSPPALMKSAFKNAPLPKTLRLEAKFERDLTYAMEIRAADGDSYLRFFTEKATFHNYSIFGRSGAGIKVQGSSLTRILDPQRSVWDQTRSAFYFDDAIEEAFDNFSKFAIYAPQTEFLREVKSGIANDPPVGLHGEGLAQAVESLIIDARPSKRAGQSENSRRRAKSKLSFINSALNSVWLPGWANQVRVGPIDPILRSRESTSHEGRAVYFLDEFMHEKRNKLSAHDSSEGTLFLLFIAVLLAHKDAPKIFALDNVDNALNPALTRKMLETIIELVARKRSEKLDRGPDQVFLTSHNPTALDAFDLFDLDQRVFIVSRNDRGHSVVTPLRPRKNWTREDWGREFKGKKLSQLWIDGDIKGALGHQTEEL